MATKVCPLLAKRCIEHKCMFYVHEAQVNSATGETREGFECLFLLQYQLERQGVVEQIRTIATVDKVDATLQAAGQGLMQIAAQRMALEAAR